MAGHHEAAGRSFDEQGACKDMALDCLIAMNCLAPIALPDAASAMESVQPHGVAYLPGVMDRLEGRQMRPESPPPQ